MPLDKKEVIKKLKERGATRPCQRCGKSNFTVLDSYSALNLNHELGGSIRIGGPNVPVALVACINCGAITAHALGALELLPIRKKEKNGKK